MGKGVAKSGTPAKTPKGFFCCLGLSGGVWIKGENGKDVWHELLFLDGFDRVFWVLKINK